MMITHAIDQIMMDVSHTCGTLPGKSDMPQPEAGGGGGGGVALTHLPGSGRVG